MVHTTTTATGNSHKKILVTGGSGMVGQAIRWVIEHEKDPRFGKNENEEWVFLGSKDGNLKYNYFIFVSIYLFY